MAIKALGSHYFEDKQFPVNLCRIERMQHITHEHDLTEVEHYHDFTELVFIIKGKGLQMIENQEYMVTAGDVFVLQGNQRHFFKDAKGVEIVNVMYDAHQYNQLISPMVKQMDGYKALFILEPRYRTMQHFKNKLHLDRSDMAKLEIIMNTMLFEQENKLEGYQLILANRLEELIVLLSRYYSNLEETEAKALVRIAKVIDYLEQNFSDKIYLDHLAELSFMSTRNFQRVFKKAVGSSPSLYLMQIRLQKARRLLRETEKPISEIAIETGFGDVNYFIKCFKKANEITPVKFRIRYRTKQMAKI